MVYLTQNPKSRCPLLRALSKSGPFLSERGHFFLNFTVIQIQHSVYYAWPTQRAPALQARQASRVWWQRTYRLCPVKNIDLLVYTSHKYEKEQQCYYPCYHCSRKKELNVVIFRIIIQIFPRPVVPEISDGTNTDQKKYLDVKYLNNNYVYVYITIIICLLFNRVRCQQNLDMKPMSQYTLSIITSQLHCFQLRDGFTGGGVRPPPPSPGQGGCYFS